MMMFANNCLELNFIIQFICYWQYSRHISLLKFYLSKVNILLSLNGTFVMCKFEFYNGILFWMFCFEFFHFFKNLIHFYVVHIKQATISHKREKVRSYTISFKLEVVDFAKKKSILAAALKCKLEQHSICGKKKQRTSYKNFPTQ